MNNKEFLYVNLDENIKRLKEIFTDAADIVFREFYAGENRLFMIYIDNAVSSATVEESILTNLMSRGKTDGNTMFLQLRTISVGEVGEVETIDDICDAIMIGDTVILCEDYNKGAQISTKGWPSRGVPKVENEVTLQGAKDSFTESSAVNIILVRRRIHDTKLKLTRMKIGKRSKTDVAVMYMGDIVRPEILQSVLDKLETIDIDMIMDSSYVQHFLQSNMVSPFPQLQLTERPDKTASGLCEGRIAILVDNSPFAILVPSTFNVFFQSADDYYEHWSIMSFLRMMRFGAAILAVTLPALYIALTVFHPNFIPTALALKIAAGRASVPFPTIVEVLIMELAFELLREAGIRLPSPMGGTIGIVGGIIIGQSAVEAGIVGPSVVIIAALTGVCGYAVPNASLVSGLRVIKYLLIVASSLFGLLGFWLGGILVLTHLCSLESFGVPYMFPFCSGSVNNYSDLKDSIIRVPLIFMRKRPIFASKHQRNRLKEQKGDK